MAPRLQRAYPPASEPQAPRPPRLRDWVVMAGICAALGAFAAFFVQYSLGRGASQDPRLIDPMPQPPPRPAAERPAAPAPIPDSRDSPTPGDLGHASPLPPDQASLSPTPRSKARHAAGAVVRAVQESAKGALAFAAEQEPVIPEVRTSEPLFRATDLWPDLLQHIETQVCGSFQRDQRRARCRLELREEVARVRLEALTSRCLLSGQAAPTLVTLDLDSPRPSNAVLLAVSRKSPLDRNIDAVLLCDPSLPESAVR